MTVSTAYPVCEVIHVSQAGLRVTVRNCANPPGGYVVPGSRKSWKFTGRVVTFHGDEYGEIEIIQTYGRNPGAGDGKFVKLSDMNRGPQVVLRNVFTSTGGMS